MDEIHESVLEAIRKGSDRGKKIREVMMPKFLNSEIAKEEELKAAEEEKAAEIARTVNKIAEYELKLIALKQVIGELALENAHLRVEVELLKSGIGDCHAPRSSELAMTTEEEDD